MVEINDPVWKELSSAGNDADKWLRCLMEGEGDFRENVEILAEDLSHQLSYYSATAYVLPHLAVLCSGLTLQDKVFLIACMGAAIAAEADYPLSSGTEPYREFQEGLEGLRRETEHLLTWPGLADFLQNDPELGQVFALAALSILGNRKHAYGLWLLSAYCWEMGHAACACGWNQEEYVFEEEDCLEPAVIGPWDGKSLEEEAVWLQGLLALAGDEEITPILPLVYGTGICPDCGRRESYWAWLERFMEEY